jgi:hypothetical protein
VRSVALVVLLLVAVPAGVFAFARSEKPAPGPADSRKAMIAQAEADLRARGATGISCKVVPPDGVACSGSGGSGTTDYELFTVDS